jgi:AP-2 complex subunit alpha
MADDSGMQMVRLTIRATDDSVPPVLLKAMEERLAAGASTVQERHVPPTASEISDSFRNIMVR